MKTSHRSPRILQSLIAVAAALLGLPGTAAAQAPATPSDVLATLQDGTNQMAAPASATVSWIDPDTTIIGFNILRSTNLAGPFATIATNIIPTSLALTGNNSGTNILRYADDTVELGVQFYYYEVVAVNATGPSAASSIAAVAYGNGNQLINSGFEAPQIAADGVGAVGAGVLLGWNNVQGDQNDQYGFLNTAGNTYYNSTTGVCPQDAMTEECVMFDAAQVGKLYTYLAPNNVGVFEQSAPVAGGTWTAGGWALSSHEDLLANPDTFYFEVDFLDGGSNILAAYESFVVTNLACDEISPFLVDSFNYLSVTNAMKVTAGKNTGVVISNTGPLGILTAPPNTASVSFSAFITGAGGGSVSFDDCVLDELVAPTLTLPVLSGVSPNNVLFCTNTNFSCSITSGDSVIKNVEVAVTTSPLGGAATTVTDPPGLTVTGTNTAAANVSLLLTPGLIYSVTVIGTDGFGLQNQTTAAFDTLAPTLVIEAADFNFSGGGFTNTPANGGLGLFVNDVGNQGVDENWVHSGAAPANDNYRPGDNVTILPAGSTTGVEQKFANVAAAIASGADPDSWDIPQSLGYGAVGDWLNYTRSYGSAATNSAPAGLYNVYADLAIDGTGAVSLYQITGDITSAPQSSNFLGNFTLTDTGWNSYYYTPLLDPYGNLVSVPLSGTATLRADIGANTPNVAFFFLAPSIGQGPTVTSVSPTGVEPYAPAGVFTFALGPGSGPSGASTVSASGVGVTLNGVNVTSSVTFSGSSTNLTASVPIAQQNVYTAVITATNSAGVVSVSTVTFNNFDPGNYSFDFSDYDFSTNSAAGWVSGLFIDDNVPSGDSYAAATPPPTYTGYMVSNSYFEYPTGFTPTLDPQGIGAIAKQGVDIDFPENGQTGANNLYYRIDENTSVGNNNNVGLYPSEDTTDGFRTKYLNARTFFGDTNIGSFQVGYFGDGNWLNYTRTFPTGNFYLWGRFAGDGGPISNTLSQVTAGVGTSNQTLTVLGNFAGPQTGNYEVFAWYPLRDAGGNMVNLAMGGKETLRLTQEGSPENAIFVMLVPAPSTLNLTATLVAGQLNISFPTQAGSTYQVLYSSVLATNPPVWTAVGSAIVGDGTVQTVTEAVTGAQGYYEIKVQ